MRYKYLMLLASSSLALGSAAHAAAQQDPAAAEPVTSVGEVLVTARKRTERLQDVPISVNVTSGEEPMPRI